MKMYQILEVRDAAFENLDSNYYLPEVPEGKDRDGAAQEELYDLLEKMEAELPPDLKSTFNEVYNEAEFNLVQNLANKYKSAHPDMIRTW